MQELFLGNQVDELTKMEQLYNAIAKSYEFKQRQRYWRLYENNHGSWRYWRYNCWTRRKNYRTWRRRTQVHEHNRHNKEIAEVENEALLNEEELLEIQELKNEALKIEEEIRNGFFYLLKIS